MWKPDPYLFLCSENATWSLNVPISAIGAAATAIAFQKGGPLLTAENMRVPSGTAMKIPLPWLNSQVNVYDKCFRPRILHHLLLSKGPGKMLKRIWSVYIPSLYYLGERYERESGPLHRPLCSQRCRFERFERPSSNYYVTVGLQIFFSTDRNKGGRIFKDAVQLNAFEAHLHSY